MSLELRYIPSILHNITKTFFFKILYKKLSNQEKGLKQIEKTRTRKI